MTQPQHPYYHQQQQQQQLVTSASDQSSAIEQDSSSTTSSSGNEVSSSAAASTASNTTRTTKRRRRFHQCHEDKWSDKYKKLVEFQQEHGHCLVPLGWKVDKELAQWWVKATRPSCSYDQCTHPCLYFLWLLKLDWQGQTSTSPAEDEASGQISHFEWWTWSSLEPNWLCLGFSQAFMGQVFLWSLRFSRRVWPLQCTC